MNNNIILTNTEIKHKIRRIAYQIYENNYNEKEIIIAGIVYNGYFISEKIADEIINISQIKIKKCKVFINKEKPNEKAITSLKTNEYENKSLILIDDVLNSGKTLIYGIKHFLDVPLKKFKTAVLVNRNHKKYPVKADFKGISLSTSIKEHVTVEVKKNNIITYLK